jgi:hypothetical protein
MGKEERQTAISEIEKERGSRVICYLTGDRQGLEARIGMDIFPFFYNLLSKIGKQRQIDLFLYSAGGATMAAWGLVNLFREYCDRFCVLVPFKAHSSATLMCLGADEIVMTPMGQLSPVDPSITSPFNPTLPNQPPGATPQFLPVSVEDVSSYLDLASEAGLKNEVALSSVFSMLSGDVRPLALGSVFRAKQQIKMLSEKLLGFHMKEKEKIDGIVSKLIRELYSHDYIIGRSEAKDQIGLKVATSSTEMEAIMVRLLEQYSEALLLQTPYVADILLGSDNTKTLSFDQGFIESKEGTYVYRTRKEIKRLRVTQQGLPMEAIQERILQAGWVLEKVKGA